MNHSIGVATMSNVLATAPTIHAQTREESAVRTVVEGVATLTDLREFEALQKLYAPEVRVDYTSLAGGEAEVKSAAALMTQWAGMLPGFDRTRHNLSDIQVRVEGPRAVSTAYVVADHCIGERRWQVSGRYDYEFARDGGEWRITAHKLTVTGEEGSRELFGPAGQVAKADPAPYLWRQQAPQALLQFLAGLEDKAMDRVNAVWAISRRARRHPVDIRQSGVCSLNLR